MPLDERELERIRRKKMMELKRRMEGAEAREKGPSEEERKAAEEAARKAILRRYLTPEARERLARVRLVRPELARAVEDYIIRLAQSGGIPEGKKLGEKEVKNLLRKLSESTRRDFRIRIDRK